MASGKFATAINCMDGRVQAPLAEWLKNNLAVDYVDTITEPGQDRILSQEATEVDSIKRRVLISVNAHHSKTVAIAGHYDCAGNPVTKEEHLMQIRKSIEAVASWNLGIRLLGFWINEHWELELVSDSAK